ncbi:hypothetical protein RLOC_00013976 [Lonchura striata]|uniref:Uncharacterized protein n=1 Tax=Lonchura striata TaxID=40157 RepID=A0A218VDD1_9PASE|nr:hypothetical protein RLOC_00013976 [Lonchura striata domestica]
MSPAGSPDLRCSRRKQVSVATRSAPLEEVYRSCSNLNRRSICLYLSRLLKKCFQLLQENLLKLTY